MLWLFTAILVLLPWTASVWATPQPPLPYLASTSCRAFLALPEGSASYRGFETWVNAYMHERYRKEPWRSHAEKSPAFRYIVAQCTASPDASVNEMLTSYVEKFHIGIPVPRASPFAAVQTHWFAAYASARATLGWWFFPLVLIYSVHFVFAMLMRWLLRPWMRRLKA